MSESDSATSPSSNGELTSAGTEQPSSHSPSLTNLISGASAGLLSGTTNGSSLFSTLFETTEFDSLNVDTLSALTSSGSTRGGRRTVTKDAIERKQLLHDLELLRIEVSQRNLMIETMKAEYAGRQDELEDKLSDALHQNQLTTAKFESHMRFKQDEFAREITRLKKELKGAYNKTNMLETKLTESHFKISTSTQDFSPVLLNEDDYLQLKGRLKSELSASDVLSVKLYEQTRALSLQCDTMQNQLHTMGTQLHDKEDSVHRLQKELEETQCIRSELEVRCQRLQMLVDNQRTKDSSHNYKAGQYDSLRSERDHLEREMSDAKRGESSLVLELKSNVQENQQLKKQVDELEKANKILTQDKEYLKRELDELMPKYRTIEQRLDETSRQLDKVKDAREELYDRYVASREKYRWEYEERLKSELSSIQQTTSTELQRIKDNTKEMFERENRNLRESRDSAILEKERAVASEVDLTTKYTELLASFRELQVGSDCSASDLASEVKIKTFELERLQLVYDDTSQQLRKLLEEHKLMQNNYENASKELSHLKNTSEMKGARLDMEMKDMKQKLAIYEKLEQELDDVVMQAAEVADDASAENILFSYGYGANVPSTSKRRMQQSVQLARRVLQLERANTSLRIEVEDGRKNIATLSKELQSATKLLNDARQPYNYLIDSMRSRDEKNQQLEKTLALMEEDLEKRNAERSVLEQTNKQLTFDLEKLLNQKEEVSVLKQVVLQLRGSHEKVTPCFDVDATSLRPTVMTTMGDSGFGASSRREKTFAPQPILMVNDNAPVWYNRLKERNQKFRSNNTL